MFMLLAVTECKEKRASIFCRLGIFFGGVSLGFYGHSVFSQ